MNEVLIKGTVVTLLASYCGGADKDCTDKHPCPECLKMCNQFQLRADVSAKYLQEVGERGRECKLLGQ